MNGFMRPGLGLLTAAALVFICGAGLLAAQVMVTGPSYTGTGDDSYIGSALRVLFAALAGAGLAGLLTLGTLRLRVGRS